MEISVALTEEETAALQRVAERSGRSLEDEALDALREYLARAARARAASLTEYPRCDTDLSRIAD